MPIELGPKGLAPARPLGAVSARTAPTAAQPTATTKVPARTAGATGEPVVERRLALDPGKPPVDTERVTQIRRAIESGTYPIVPAKVADAMIAAGILLRTGK